MKKIIFIILFVAGMYPAYKFIPGVKEAIILATTVKPETFTELYFENHLQLPTTPTLYKTVNFAFTVHNLEYKDTTYQYEVYIECQQKGCNGEKQMIDKGNITLKQDEYKTISETYTLTLPTRKIQVITNLINKNQRIFFWENGANKEVQPEPTQVVVQSVPTQPKKVTELYFNSSPPLPLRLASNQTINFAFTVHDLEKKDIAYSYEAYMEEDGKVIQINNGQFSLKQNEYKVITESYTPATPVGQARIFVKLTNKKGYIYFKINSTE